MLRACDFSTVIFQATIFTPNISAFSTPKLLATILGKYAQIYDGPVQALPLPEGAPPEFPRVILQSNDGVFKLEAYPTRINSFSTQSIGIKVNSEDVFNSCVEVLEHYVREVETSVDRIALVLTRVFKIEKPAQSLIEKFCKPDLQNTLFGNSESFEIHNHKQLQIETFSINSWIRCKTASLTFPDSSVPVVLVEQELNTLTVEIEKRKFAVEDIRSFFNLALEEAQNILQTYFPNEN